MPVLPAVCRCSGGGGEPGPVPKPVRHATTVDLCAWCPEEGDDCECQAVHRVVIRDREGRVVEQRDYEGDGTTPLRLGAGCVVTPCSECPCGHDEPGPAPDPRPYTTPVSLCDWDGGCDGCTSFVRWMTLDPDTGEVTTVDTTAEGEPYEVQGLVVDCAVCPSCGGGEEPCVPVPMCPGLDALDGDQHWELPPGTESVSVHVVCGPTFIKTCCGKDTQALNHEHEIIRIDEAGTTMTWAAPSLGCAPGELCSGFCVWTGDCGRAYVQYLSSDCEESCLWDESESESWGGFESDGEEG